MSRAVMLTRLQVARRQGQVEHGKVLGWQSQGRGLQGQGQGLRHRSRVFVFKFLYACESDCMYVFMHLRGKRIEQTDLCLPLYCTRSISVTCYHRQ